MNPLHWGKIQPMRKLFLLIFLLVFLTGCESAVTAVPSQKPVAVLTDTPVFLPTRTVQTSSTVPTAPTVTQSPTRVILVVPPEADENLKLDVRSTLTDLVSASGYLLDELPSLSATDLDESIQMVVVLSPFSGLDGLAAAWQKTLFVAVGIKGLSAAENITVIGDVGVDPARQAFLAGYIAALTAWDWRAGALTASSVEGQTAASTFENGVRYFCGLCRPAFPPFFTYPQTVEFAPGDQASWMAAADQLVAGGVQVVYVDPDISSPDLLQYLVDANVNLIGAVTPPEASRSNWIATIQPDPAQALRQVWSDLLAGKGGQQIAMPLVITDTQSGLLSPARQRLAQQTLDGLLLGTINPNSVP
jgi:hypothetical protein